MKRNLLALTLLLCGGAAFAQERDMRDSAQCQQALGALQAQESAARASGPAGDGTRREDTVAKLNALRDRAARACLGGPAAPRTLPQHLAQPPIRVEPIATPMPLAPPSVSAAAPALAPVLPVQPTLVTITTCDPGGCWASDGSRLQRFGPNLVGPRGVCTVQASQLHCP
jgi:hypothetical protein